MGAGVCINFVSPQPGVRVLVYDLVSCCTATQQQQCLSSTAATAARHQPVLLCVAGHRTANLGFLGVSGELKDSIMLLTCLVFDPLQFA
jgi:hypothetical protein